MTQPTLQIQFDVAFNFSKLNFRININLIISFSSVSIYWFPRGQKKLISYIENKKKVP